MLAAILFQVKVDNDEDTCKLSIPKCKRGDTGKYKVKLSNEFGEDEGEIDVIVLGRYH